MNIHQVDVIPGKGEKYMDICWQDFSNIYLLKYFVFYLRLGPLTGYESTYKPNKTKVISADLLKLYFDLDMKVCDILL